MDFLFVQFYKLFVGFHAKKIISSSLSVRFKHVTNVFGFVNQLFHLFICFTIEIMDLP